MFCGNCGKKLEDGVTSCPECGTEVGGSVSADVAAVTEIPTEVSEAVTEIPTEVSEAVSEIPTEVSEAVTEIPTEVSEAVSEIPTEVSEAVSEIPTEVSEAVSEIPTEVSEAVSEIPTEVSEAVTEISTELGDAVEAVEAEVEAIPADAEHVAGSTFDRADFGYESSTGETLSYGEGVSEDNESSAGASYVGTEIYSGDGGKKHSKLPVVIIAACAVVVVALVIGGYFLFRTPTINLNEYLKVDFEGYDTVGKVSVEFDASKMYKDYKKAFEFTEDAEDEIDEDEFKLKTGNKLREKAYLEDFFSQKNLTENIGKFDAVKGLANDDTVNFEWKIDKEEFERYFKCKIKFNDESYVVSGLKKAESFDPFKEIEIKISGTAPYARAEYRNKFTGEFRGLLFEFENLNDKQNKLKNGDKVTLVLKPGYGYEDVVEYCIAEFEKIPSKTRMEFEVKGIEEYVTKASQVKEADLNIMKQGAEKYLNESYLSIDEGSLQYVGSCFLLAKEYTYGASNYLHLVYKYTRPESLFESAGTRYISVYYSDLKLKADGSVDVDLDMRRRSGNSGTIAEWYKSEISTSEKRFNVEKNYTEE